MTEKFDMKRAQRAGQAVADVYGLDRVPWMLIVGTEPGRTGSISMGNTSTADQVEMLRAVVERLEKDVQGVELGERFIMPIEDPKQG
jgi:hypothetical protein